MASSTEKAGKCEKCQTGDVMCRFNDFDRGDLRVMAWEHKCTDCGIRVTQAWRSDQPNAGDAPEGLPTCPWCGRTGKTA